MTPFKNLAKFNVKPQLERHYCWFAILLALAHCTVSPCRAYTVDNNPYHHFMTLDTEGKYELEWLVDWQQRRITFNVTVQTTGYVGFGLSSSISGNSKMAGADIVLGGVDATGQPYFSDRHAVANQLPIEDDSQDWILHSAWEREKKTFLSFSRPFDTCDEDHDIPINDNFLSVIWAFGEKDDEIEYHHQNRGSFDVYLLDADLTPGEVLPGHRTEKLDSIGDWKVWTIKGQNLMPAKDTTYMCTIHKAPQGRKKHIIGFNSILPNEVDRRHIHHFLLHRCNVPSGVDAASIFQRHVGNRGEECYILNEPAGRISTQYCREVVHVWEVNGNPIFYPDHVGIPMSESTNEYYLLQMHYDNPEALSGITLNYALEIFYTENLRKHDGGAMTIGEMTPASPSILVPPSSLAHVTYGHCGGGCTDKILPKEGIHIFAVNLHTHLAGRGVQLIHIRNEKELPWVLYDNNYNFNFQQVRILREERTILPGDTLINRCVYSNTDRNGNVTVGGFSSRNEMCNGFIWYYNKIPNQPICRSEIRSDEYRSFLNIWNTTWSNSRIENIVTAPSQNAGLAVSQVGNRIDWTIEKRNQLENYHRYLPQITSCPPVIRSEAPISRTPPFVSRHDSLRRNNVNANRVYDPTIASMQKEIMDPEYEFVTVYSKDIVPYELPSSCGKK